MTTSLLRLAVPSCVAAALLLLAPPPGEAQRRRPGQRWERMDYGPFLSATITAPWPRGNTANKGVAVHLGDQAAVCFDTDLLRYSAGWTGEFLHLRGTPFDGGHGSHPSVKGKMAFATPATPGWAKPGTDDFSDPRPEPYGPLPHARARYKGLYRSGDRVVFRYTVGDAVVLDSPGLRTNGGRVAFTRTLNVGPSRTTLTHVVAASDRADGASVKDGVGMLKGDAPLAVGLVSAPPGAALKADKGRILLTLPPLPAGARFQIVLAPGGMGNAAADLGGKPGELDLAKFTRGGPARWTQPVVTKGVLGKGDGPYVVDTLTTPEQNPYNSWMRFGGLDFFPDGRAAVCTWSGDVWVVSGIDAKLEKLTWKRFATGLFQPLGLRIVGDKIYTLGREGIVRLHDLDGDGEADFYEAFNNDVATTPGFHEFAFDLQTDSDGNFYYAKAGPVRGGGRGFEYIAAHSGCLLKIDREGKKHTVFATGFRAPNGIGVGPRGEVTSGDNEGTWTPMCRLSLVLPGSFNGCVDTAHRSTPPDDYDRPVCWFPKHIDNSSGGQVWVTSKKWGPLYDHLLHMSYGQSSLYHVLLEGAGKEVQGGVVRMPVNFLTGVMRARFAPQDGQLYVTGLRGWQTNAPRDAALQRVRYTGKPLHTVASMKVVHDGLALTFTNKLDPKTAADAENYSAEQWNYLWCSEYGSDHYSTTTPDFDAKVREYNRLRRDRRKNAAAISRLAGQFKKGHDKVTIRAAKLSADGKTVTLEVPGLKPVMQMHLKFRVKAADGTPLPLEVYSTINRVP
jgi:hypothetical protein